MSKKNNDPIFKLFASEFKVDLFYIPSMVGIDIMYVIVLDNTVRLSIKLFGNNILAIQDIEPLSESYLVKYYEKLIEFLRDQTKFTVLISKLGCNQCIDSSCSSLGIPLVEDSRFLTVPQRLYDAMSAKFSGQPSRYGVYVIAVADNFETVEPVQIGTVTAIDRFKTLLYTNDICEEVTEYTMIPDSYQFEYKGITVVFKEATETIDIIQMTDTTSISVVIYMELFEKLEKITDDIPINVVNTTNYCVKHVCDARQYEKIAGYHITSRNSFGTYRVSPLTGFRPSH